MRGVETVDIGRRIGFGITEFLRLGEDVREGAALLAHFRQDVIAGAVENAVDAVDAVRREAFAQRLDDRNAAGDRRLEIERHAGRFGGFGKGTAVHREQRLVGRHDMPASGDGSFAQRLGRTILAADQFDDDIRIGLPREADGIVEPGKTGNVDAAVGRPVARRNRRDFKPAAAARRQQVAMCGDDAHDAGADRSETGNRDT